MSEQVQHYYQTPGHVIAAGVVLSLLDIFVVALRFASRRKFQQPLKLDDWLLVPAMLLSVGVGVCLVYGVHEGAFGYREIPTSPTDPSLAALEQMSVSIKLEWTISLLLPFALGCTKASFLYFYMRIFSINKAVKWWLLGFVGVIAAWVLAFFFATLFCCKVMVFYIWKPISEMAQCDYFLHVLMAFCVTGFVFDLVIIAIPIPIIWNLQLSRGHKWLASASFLLGAVTVATALARLIVSVEFVRTAMDPATDMILNITTYVYWGMVESAIGVFAACLPTLQFLFRRWTWESLRTRTRGLLSSSTPKSSRKSFGFHRKSQNGKESKNSDNGEYHDEMPIANNSYPMEGKPSVDAKPSTDTRDMV